MIPTKEKLHNHQQSVAAIRLLGEPYHQERDGKIIDCTDTLEALALNSNYLEYLKTALEANQDNLAPLYNGGYYGLDAKLKKGQPLTYEDAFSLMTFVSMGVNSAVFAELSDRLPAGMPNDPDTIFYQSIALLSAMSAKEGFIGLSAEEIAGLTAAALEIDTIIRVPSSDLTIGIGGMGGDRGYKRNGDSSKLFSLSTLSAIVLSNFGPVHKHHSYPNTSKVAGQSAIEAYGALSNQSEPQEFRRIQDQVSLLMSSCHTTRTIHTLSHRLKGETINHVVGPLAIPINAETPTTAFIGVNDNVHPETIIAALKILKAKGVQAYENSVAFCGLNTSDADPSLFDPKEYYQNAQAKLSVAIDEVAPPPYSTIAAFLVGGKNKGTYLLEPLDFMTQDELVLINYKELLIPNTTDAILSANTAALSFQDQAKSRYLAMTGALALFTREYAHLPQALDPQTRRVNRGFLRHAYTRVLGMIRLGQGLQKLQDYIAATNQS